MGEIDGWCPKKKWGGEGKGKGGHVPRKRRYKRGSGGMGREDINGQRWF